MMTRRSLAALLTAGLLLAMTVPAVAAHVELVSSVPPAGANLQTAPTVVTITFDDELDADPSRFAVVGSAGSTQVGSGAVDLTVADRNVMTGPVTITEPGVYTVSYQVAGVDGHLLEGAFSFGYRAGEAVPNPTVGQHADTAMRRPLTGPSSILAAMLLLGAGALAARHIAASRR